jgi:glutathione S-transferase
MRLQNCTLTYFDLPARAEASRLALSVANIPFTDNRIPFSAWKTLKPTTPWGSLPILTLDDGTVIAQQRAILRFIGRETGLYPSDAVAAAKVDEIMDGAEDIMGKTNAVGKDLPQNEKEEARSAACKEGGVIFTILSNIERQLQLNEGPFSVGNSLTIADFFVYTSTSTLISGLFDGVPSNALDPFPKIHSLRTNVRSNPSVCKFYDNLGDSMVPSSFDKL